MNRNNNENDIDTIFFIFALIPGVIMICLLISMNITQISKPCLEWKEQEIYECEYHYSLFHRGTCNYIKKNKKYCIKY